LIKEGVTMIRLMVIGLVVTLAVVAGGAVVVKEDTPLYALEADVLATLPVGGSVEMIGETGAWYKVLVPASEAGGIQGLVAKSGVVKKGDRVEALRETPIYAMTRATMATIPAGAKIEVIRAVNGGYVVQYIAEDGERIEGLVRSDAIVETEELAAWRKEIAAAERFEATYQAGRYKYALVQGEFVRLPDFDLSRASSDPKGEPQLPAWEVGAFGYVPWAKVKQVFAPDCALVTARIYHTGIETISPGGSGGTFNPGAIRSLEPVKMAVTRADDEKIMLSGWATEKMADGHMLWEDADARDPSAYIAIIGNHTYRTPVGAKVTVLQAIPLRQVRRGLSREEFRALVKQLESQRQ
jgi:hypothetical protein